LICLTQQRQSTFDAIEISQKPIAITHANPSFWHPAKRNKSNDLLKALSDNDGMLGLSLYPHHLKNNTDCSLESFCEMVAKTAEIMNVKNIGIGSDLCLRQPDSIVEWMRNGTWSKVEIMEKAQKINQVFQNNLPGLRMLEVLQILKKA
jgi:membrane dipeptidase